jgi:hypothetical protein
MSIVWQIAYTKGNATTRKTSFGASEPATAAMGAAAHKGAGVFPGRFGNKRVERSAFHDLGRGSSNDFERDPVARPVGQRRRGLT